MRLGVLVAMFAGACVGTDTTICGDAVCPAGTSCAMVTTETGATQTRCVQPGQIAACADLDDRVACSLAGVASATCIGGACFPDACGDGLRGAIEACDDANVTSGDGCASDCRSAEVCGNGIVDPVVLVEGTPAANELCDDGNFLAHDGCGLCATENPKWSLVPHLPPTIRAYHAMAADSRRHEVVMFGGADGNSETPNETWIWNGESWHAQISDIMPPGRVATAMAYDSARDRLVVFAGSEPSFSVPTRDLWEWDGTRWEERGAAGPRSRMEHAMAYDSIREKTILVGGLGYSSSSFDYLDETWLWDGTTWTLHQPASPAETIPPRSRSALAFDPVRGETVLFGGSNGAVLSNETWLFDGARWRRATTTQAPSGRFAPAMAWDPTSRRVILFGGLNGSAMADAWAWDGTSWTPLPGGPPARFSGAMSSDFERGGVVLYGGVNNSTPSARDTWWWDGSAWHDETRVYVPDLSFAGVATDLARDIIVAFGGRPGATTVDTTREYVRGSWYERSLATRPAARQLQQMVYMPSIGKVVMWGGINGNGTPVNDGTWGWDGTAWQRLALAANTPVRIEIASTFDAERNEIVAFGGRTAFNLDQLDETWVFDGATWTLRTPATLPPARGGAALGYDPIRRRVVMTAGQVPGDFASDLWTWDGANWTEHAQPTRPPARVGGTLIWSPRRKRLLLAGGVDNATSVTDDVWELDDTTWFRVNAIAPPRATNSIAATIDGILRISSGAPGAMWRLRWESQAADEVCSSEIDLDGDALVGCADPDCDNRCTGCGDGSCSLVEDCHLCPTDCGACAERCGDATCDQGESAASCPGDC